MTLAFFIREWRGGPLLCWQHVKWLGFGVTPSEFWAAWERLK